MKVFMTKMIGVNGSEYHPLCSASILYCTGVVPSCTNVLYIAVGKLIAVPGLRSSRCFPVYVEAKKRRRKEKHVQ